MQKILRSRKVLSILLVLIMAFAFSANAFAAPDSGTGTIIISSVNFGGPYVIEDVPSGQSVKDALLDIDTAYGGIGVDFGPNQAGDWLLGIMGEYPSLGKDGKYYSLWLKALASGSYTPPAGGGDAAGGSTVLTPKVTAVNGTAAATVSTSDVSTAIDNAKKNDSTAITIAPEITGTAKKVSVELPKASVSSIGSDTKADLKIETPVGSMTIPNDALASVVSQAGRDTISVALESVEPKTLTADQQKLVGENLVFDISITSGGKPISSFGGKSITISLPYTLKSGEKAESVVVWYLSDDGKLERMVCKYDKATGLATFTTAHLSNYLVGYDEWTRSV